MSIEFNCPECGHHYNVADAHAGKRTMCKGCGGRIQVPGQKVGPQPGVPAHPMAQAPAAQATAPTPTARPYGASPSGPTASKPMKRKLNALLIVAVALSMLGMVLPWISWPDETPKMVKDQFGSYVSGFQLPFVVNSKLSELRDSVATDLRTRGQTEENIDIQLAKLDSVITTFRSLYALLLIPILALLTLADELTAAKKGKNRWWLRIINTLSPVIAFVVILVAFTALAELTDTSSSSGGSSSSNSSGDWSVVGIGFWIMCLGAVVSFVSIFTSPKPEVDVATNAFTPRARPKLPGGPGITPASAPGPVRAPGAARPPGVKRPGPNLPRPRQ